MAATIQFPEGTEATLIDGKGTWVCEDKYVEQILDHYTLNVLERCPYYPNPIEGLARDVAAAAGAKLIRVDEDPFDKGEPGRIY